MSVSIIRPSLTRQGTSNTFVARWYYSGKKTKTLKVYKDKKSYKKKKYSTYQQIDCFIVNFHYYLPSNNMWYIGDADGSFSKTNPTISIDGKKYYEKTYSLPEEATAVKVIISFKYAKYNACTGKKGKYKSKSTKMVSSDPKAQVKKRSRTDSVLEVPNLSVSLSGSTIKSVITTPMTENKIDLIDIRYKYQDAKVDKYENLQYSGNYLTHNYAAKNNTTYRISVRGKNKENGWTSDWSAESEISTVLSAPKNLKTTAGSEEGTIILTWDAVEGVQEEGGYTIEYTNNKSYFDASSNVQSETTTINSLILSVDMGYEWYFRVRAINSAGNSAWSDIVSQVSAKVPEAPTTWTLKSSFSITDQIVLYFTHNSEDNSKLQSYKISYKVNGVTQPEITETPPTTTEENPIYSYNLTEKKPTFYAVANPQPSSQSDLDSNYNHLYTSSSEGSFTKCTSSSRWSSSKVYYEIVSYNIDTTILWKIKTKGVHPDYGKYSIEREVKIYTDPSINIDIESYSECDPQPSQADFENDPESFYYLVLYSECDPQPTEDEFNDNKLKYYYIYGNEYVRCNETDVFDDQETYYIYEEQYIQCSYETIWSSDVIYYELSTTISKLPIEIHLSTTPLSQKPISYSVDIYNINSYETTDILGNEKYVLANTLAYSKIFINTDGTNDIDILIEPGDILLENTQEYTIAVTAVMDSGLSAKNEQNIDVSWIEDTYTPDADATMDEDSFTCTIFPVCYKNDAPYISSVSETPYSEDQYTFDSSIFEVYINYNSGDYVFIYDNGWTYNGAAVDISNYGFEILEGVVISNGDEIILSYDMEQIIEDEVVLDVYRKNVDNTFTEIATDMPNSENSIVIDPHPDFGLTTYRVIARNKYTSSLGFIDYEVENSISSIVIQWDETYKRIVSDDEDAMNSDSETSIYSGTVLVLPYNIKTSESNNKDVSLVEYIGRKHPVSYYGTQRGSSATWNADIPKDDVETLALLRRLDVYPGDVYVREPNGTGYVANVSVSFNIGYDSLTIPVSMSVNHVEE